MLCTGHNSNSIYSIQIYNNQTNRLNQTILSGQRGIAQFSMYSQFVSNAFAIHSCSSNEIKTLLLHTIKTTVFYWLCSYFSLAVRDFSILRNQYTRGKAMLKPAKCQVYVFYLQACQCFYLWRFIHFFPYQVRRNCCSFHSDDINILITKSNIRLIFDFYCENYKNEVEWLRLKIVSVFLLNIFLFVKLRSF